MESNPLESAERIVKNEIEKELVNETQELFKRYKDARDTWATHAQEDREFRLGKQWTAEQKKVLESRGQSPIVVNRIHPAVETAKALITANRPSFKVAPREDSDNKVANVLSNLLTYIYDISDGRNVIRQVVDDYYVTGLGYIQVYQDPMADYNRGEVKFIDIDPMDVYVDPNSRDRFFNDAENIIISRRFSKDQAKKLYPMFKEVIDDASGEDVMEYPTTSRVDDGEVHFPSDVKDTPEDEYIRGYERYQKVIEVEWRCYESWSGREYNHTKDEYAEYLKTPAFLVGMEGDRMEAMTVITKEAQATSIIANLMNKRNARNNEVASKDMEAYDRMEGEMLDAGLSPEEYPGYTAPETNVNPGAGTPGLGEYPEESFNDPAKLDMRKPVMEQVTYADLLKLNKLKCVQIQIPRVKYCVIVGDDMLYKRILPVEDYPIIPFCNLHTRTPYPVSDVRMVKNLQQYINKTRSLIIAHATTSTNTKILIPEGSVDMKDFEEKWAQPGVAIPVDMDAGAPMPVQPVPLPNELYKNENDAKQDIDHQLGLYEMMMGNTQVAPQTYKATISLDEFGQRKIKSKLADIEGALVQVARVVLPMAQQLYKTEKVFRIIQANNSIDEYTINKKLYDDKTKEISIFNDISVGAYDNIFIAGSTLPSNRYAELEFYMDAYSKGIIDRQEVLMKTEVFDAPGVLQRQDTIENLQKQLKTAGDMIKKLKGDMQTRDREAVSLRKKVEVEKFGAQLDKMKNRTEASNTLFESRLDDLLASIKKELTAAEKEKQEQSKKQLRTPSKKASKKG